RRRGRTRARADPAGAHARRRQHLRDRAAARADPPRALSEAPASGAGIAGASAYQVISQLIDWLVRIQYPPGKQARHLAENPFDSNDLSSSAVLGKRTVPILVLYEGNDGESHRADPYSSRHRPPPDGLLQAEERTPPGHAL